jgi:hypothetical protein
MEWQGALFMASEVSIFVMISPPVFVVPELHRAGLNVLCAYCRVH